MMSSQGLTTKNKEPILRPRLPMVSEGRRGTRNIFKITPAPYLIFLAMVPFGNLSVSEAWPWITPTKLGFLFLVAYLVYAFTKGWRPPPLPGLMMVMGVFVIGVTASAAWSAVPGDCMVHLVRLVALASLAVITGWVAAEDKTMSMILVTLFVIAAAVSLLGIAQTLTGKTFGGFGLYSYFGRMITLYDRGDPDGPTIVRAAATFDHPNLFGAFLVAALPAALVSMSRVSARQRIGWAAAIVVAVVALVFTFSRSAWLGFAAAVIVLLVLRAISIRVLVPLLLAGLLAIALCPAAARTILGRRVTASQAYDVGRLYSYRAAGQMMVGRPIQGVGPGQFPAAYPDYAHNQEDYHQSSMHHMDAHNTFLGLGAETGLVGLLPFLGLLGLALITVWRKRDAIALCLLAALIGLTVQGLFHSLQYQEILWILIGCCFAVGASSRGRVDTR